MKIKVIRILLGMMLYFDRGYRSYASELIVITNSNEGITFNGTTIWIGAITLVNWSFSLKYLRNV